MNEAGYNIRPATFEDADDIFHLIKRYRDELLPRPINDISRNIDRFLVCEISGVVAGCVSWDILPEVGAPHDPSIEIKSLAVDEQYRKAGIGRQLVHGAIERVKSLDPSRIIALTFTPDFFLKLGFVRYPKEKLIHKIYAGCVNCTKFDSPFTCPEVAVVLDTNKFRGVRKTH